MDHLHIQKIFNAVSIAASGTAYVDINLDRLSPDGFFSLQLHVTGDGVIDAAWLASLDGGNTFVKGAADGSASVIAADLSKSTGPGSDGKHIFSFDPYTTSRIRIMLTETGGANGVTVSGWICIQ
jgi:hypothetical protein